MEQLKMIWHNDNTPPQPVTVPAGCAIVPFSQLGGALDAWLDIVQYGLSDGRKDAAYYQSTNRRWKPARTTTPISAISCWNPVSRPRR